MYGIRDHAWFSFLSLTIKSTSCFWCVNPPLYMRVEPTLIMWRGRLTYLTYYIPPYCECAKWWKTEKDNRESLQNCVREEVIYAKVTNHLSETFFKPCKTHSFFFFKWTILDFFFFLQFFAKGPSMIFFFFFNHPVKSSCKWTKSFIDNSGLTQKNSYKFICYKQVKFKP